MVVSYFSHYCIVSLAIRHDLLFDVAFLGSLSNNQNKCQDWLFIDVNIYWDVYHWRRVWRVVAWSLEDTKQAPSPPIPSPHSPL